MDATINHEQFNHEIYDGSINYSTNNYIKII